MQGAREPVGACDSRERRPGTALLTPRHDGRLLLPALAAVQGAPLDPGADSVLQATLRYTPLVKRRKPKWTYFLLRRTGFDLQIEMRAAAQAEDVSLAEIIRSALCEHYELDCFSPAQPRREDAWDATDTILLRLEAKLMRAIRVDAANSGKTMRACILDILEARFMQSAVA